MKLENRSTKISVAFFALLVISLSLIAPAISFKYGQSAAGADYVIFEGVAGNDYYDSMQYSYKINQWAYENILEYPSFDPSDDYFDASRSLRIGATEYGEFATPAHAGIAYGADASEWGDTESWASTAVLEKYWIQGWVFFMNYTRQGLKRCIEAWAIYSDLTTTEGGRAVYSWKGQYMPNHSSAELTAGTLIPSGIKVLYDSARLGVARTDVIIHDGKYDEDVAKVVITIIFNKDTKYAIVLKDIKILLDAKVLDSIQDFCFTERYELDIIRKLNPSNQAYIHYFHNYNDTVYQHPLTGESKYDVVQAYDPDHRDIFFAGYWPNATEYTVYNPLVPDLPDGEMRILNWGTATADIPEPTDTPSGPGEPSTPWVITQWRYNSTSWPHMLHWLAKAANRQMRFVEVVGMTGYTDNPHPAWDPDDTSMAPAMAPAMIEVRAGGSVDTEVWYLLDQVFNPEDLNSLETIESDGSAPFMWIGLGQSAATTDSGGSSMLGGNSYGWETTAFPLFDRNDTAFPWIAPVIGMKGTIPYGLSKFSGNYYESFSNSGKGTGTDTTTYKRTALNGFAFGSYDGDYYSPPQPIAGGWSYYEDYWYPSKNPLTERWSYTGSFYSDMYDDIEYSPNGILTLGGMKANGLTRYFNDFDFAISREGTSAYALINGGTVTGSAPTSDFDKATYDYFPLSTWNVSQTTFGYKEGYAVIALARDINGTRGLSIYGWDGRDTFWAAAWASQYIIGSTTGWLPDGTVALILKMTYAGANREPTGFTVVKALGTITEFGTNDFASMYNYDNSAKWSGLVEVPSYPQIFDDEYAVWWYAKLHTTSTALVDFDQ